MSTELSDSLNKLSLAESTKTATQKKKKPVIADSWDDEEISDDEPVETPDKVPSPPPPTPTTPHSLSHSRESSSVSSIASPRGPSSPHESYLGGPDSFSRDGAPTSSERPRKTDAVARRLIAGALGVRSRSTKEQREYDAAVRAVEKKKRDTEREKQKAEEAERERLKASIWED